MTHEGEQLAPGSEWRRRRVCIPAAGPLLIIDERGQLSAVGAEPDDIAVAQSRNRTAGKRLGADMDRRRNLA